MRSAMLGTTFRIRLRTLPLFRLARANFRDALRVRHFETLLGSGLIVEIGNGHAR